MKTLNKLCDFVSGKVLTYQSVLASLRGQSNIAVANVVGSNIFNVLVGTWNLQLS